MGMCQNRNPLSDGFERRPRGTHQFLGCAVEKDMSHLMFGVPGRVGPRQAQKNKDAGPLQPCFKPTVVRSFS